MGLLVCFSSIGVLIRVGLGLAFKYKSQPVFGLIYAQIVGCLFMGAAISRRATIMNYYPPLYTAITTGLCGSITTFSSWNLGLFEAFANYDQGYDHGVDNFLSALSIIIITLGMSVASLLFGKYISEVIFGKEPEELEVPKTVRAYSVGELSSKDYLGVALGIATLVVFIVIPSTVKNQRAITFAALFGPIGTFIRWQLAPLNAKRPGFPIGTFLANMFGTAILASLSLITHETSNITSCQILAGMADGLCGCLTTISTFTNELITLPKRKALIYGFVSLLLGQSLMVLILGSYLWTKGDPWAACSTH
ncbi:hypothetical protein K493DRAFT_223375 [Basidiobolus meristosporus CBS 931.73]|uniref:CRCB-domain-containing protein n=1 Tax=Basidiobolus meristosporus CBS 931.73 TaxID=1314790 RepID=A0A1Y1Y6C0_9FUNG|nr:hypothetical protein K493DRAFT_223375 [Basidiobolus meristosporus CBS 931.73]|eukprot:ORX93445.1 hypothetical protein K493DRAFT_223375 [Basidiobolus meristosporus CBS 931.73]